MSRQVVVNGSLMRGQVAHWRLRGATFLGEVKTAPRYRLFSIGDHYPALVRDDECGVAVSAEVYAAPDDLWERVLAAEPAGMYGDAIELDDGRYVDGMLGEASFVRHYGTDISAYGSWAAYPRRATGIHSQLDPSVQGFALFVNGTLMRGLKLHANLEGAPFLGEFYTAPCYRIHSIGDVHPGMYRLEDGESGGISVPGEIYFLSDAIWATVEAGEPPNLYRGRVLLHDGSEVWGILYPRELAEGHHPDISSFGGWRGYIARDNQ